MSGSFGLLLGLILLAFVGGRLGGHAQGERTQTASGFESLLLGFALGPSALGVIEQEWVVAFKPLLVAGGAWLAFSAGLGPHHPRTPVTGGGRLTLLGLVLAALSSLGVAWVCLVMLERFAPASAAPLPLCIGSAVVATSLAPHGAYWLSNRDGARLPYQWLLRLSRGAGLVPALGLAWVFAEEPDHGLVQLNDLGRVAVTLGGGLVLGGLTTVLLARAFRHDESWGLLLGACLLATGVSVRLGLSSVASLYIMGSVVAATSRHRNELRLLVAPSQRAVLFPLALLVGALVRVPAASWAQALLVTAVTTGLAFAALRALAVRAVFRYRGARVPLAAIGLLLPGSLGLCAALELSARLPGPLGETLLFVGASVLTLGHLIDLLIARPYLRRARTESMPPATSPLMVVSSPHAEES